jgi:type IV pilus assembly protein PilA
VTKDAEPEAIVAGLGTPKVSGGVVALAVCASMVPILGILAAIAIPAYQDYLIRAQVSEGLTAAAPYKAAVAESFAQGNDFADISTESLQFESQTTGKYVDTIEVVGGVVVITYGKQANTHLKGQQIGLLPGTNEQDEVVWTCGLAAVPDGVEPAVDEDEQYTTVPPKYLPSLCRGS